MKRRIFIFILISVFATSGWLLQRAIQSAAFLVREVQVLEHPVQAPVTAAAVKTLAAIPVGRVNLFSLDLQQVQRRILSNSWIRSVRIWKRPPDTVAISVTFREPKGIFQHGDGTVSYVDPEGTVFGEVNLAGTSDLPVFSGFSAPERADTRSLIREAVEFSDSWSRARVSKVSEISAVSWDADKGMRASVVYPLKTAKRSARVTVELGNLTTVREAPTWRIIDANLEKVLRYLSNNSVSAHQIFVGDGKKIVVRTAPGS